MTVQALDRFYYNNTCYTLIDVEKNKQIIDSAVFDIPKHEVSISSSCWRGYTAKYWIANKKLYGQRYENDCSSRKRYESTKMYMNYTGSCIVARAIDEHAKWYISDFLECYLDYDEVLELHFHNGVLDEVRSLEKALEEYQLLEQDQVYRSENTKPTTRKILRQKIACKYLKYEYGLRSYKWRGSGVDKCEE